MINTTHVYGESVVENLKSANYDAFKRKGLYAWMMMVDGNFKYIRYFKDDVIEELYDLEQDPEELVNLAVETEQVKKLTELRAKAAEEFRKRDGEFVKHLPAPKMASELAPAR